MRRLLLENVLLLAGRRIPADTGLDVNNPEAIEVMKGKFGRAILNIYKHYADMADRRRSQELDRDNKTSEAGVGMSNIYKTKSATKKEVPLDAQSSTSARAKDLRRFHDTIGYIEFFKVFNLYLAFNSPFLVYARLQTQIDGFTNSNPSWRYLPHFCTTIQ